MFAQVGIFECLDADMTLVTETSRHVVVESSGCQRLAQPNGSPGCQRVNYRNVYLSLARSGWLTMDEIYNGLMRLRGPVAKTEIVGFCRSAKGLVGSLMIEYKWST